MPKDGQCYLIMEEVDEEGDVRAQIDKLLVASFFLQVNMWIKEGWFLTAVFFNAKQFLHERPLRRFGNSL